MFEWVLLELFTPFSPVKKELQNFTWFWERDNIEFRASALVLTHPQEFDFEKTVSLILILIFYGIPLISMEIAIQNMICKPITSFRTLLLRSEANGELELTKKNTTKI